MRCFYSYSIKNELIYKLYQNIYKDKKNKAIKRIVKADIIVREQFQCSKNLFKKATKTYLDDFQRESMIN